MILDRIQDQIRSDRTGSDRIWDRGYNTSKCIENTAKRKTINSGGNSEDPQAYCISKKRINQDELHTVLGFSPFD